MAYSSHTTYTDALRSAVALARKLQREVGIESMVQFGQRVHLVHMLPKPQFRFGFELRCETVQPSDPMPA